MKEIAGGIFIGCLFLTTSYISEHFSETLRASIGPGGSASALGYVASVITLALVPLGSTLPLIPVAVAVWGKTIAAFLTIGGWMISAAIAFFISRRFGKPIVERLVPIQYVTWMRDMIPKKNLHIGVVVIALIGAPVDIASYTLGLFSTIRARSFLPLLLIGQIPFAFFVASTATLPLLYQTYIVGVMILAWSFFYSRLKSQSNGGEA